MTVTNHIVFDVNLFQLLQLLKTIVKVIDLIIKIHCQMLYTNNAIKKIKMLVFILHKTYLATISTIITNKFMNLKSE